MRSPEFPCFSLLPSHLSLFFLVLDLRPGWRAAPGAAPQPARLLVDFDVLLRDAVAKVCNVAPARVQPGTRLVDLGVDSLSAAEILVEVEIQVGRDLPVDALRRLDGVVTVGDVATQLKAELGVQS